MRPHPQLGAWHAWGERGRRRHLQECCNMDFRNVGIISIKSYPLMITSVCPFLLDQQCDFSENLMFLCGDNCLPSVRMPRASHISLLLLLSRVLIGWPIGCLCSMSPLLRALGCPWVFCQMAPTVCPKASSTPSLSHAPMGSGRLCKVRAEWECDAIGQTVIDIAKSTQKEYSFSSLLFDVKKYSRRNSIDLQMDIGEILACQFD